MHSELNKPQQTFTSEDEDTERLPKLEMIKSEQTEVDDNTLLLLEDNQANQANFSYMPSDQIPDEYKYSADYYEQNLDQQQNQLYNQYNDNNQQLVYSSHISISDDSQHSTVLNASQSNLYDESVTTSGRTSKATDVMAKSKIELQEEKLREIQNDNKILSSGLSKLAVSRRGKSRVMKFQPELTEEDLREADQLRKFSF